MLTGISAPTRPIVPVDSGPGAQALAEAQGSHPQRAWVLLLLKWGGGRGWDRVWQADCSSWLCLPLPLHLGGSHVFLCGPGTPVSSSPCVWELQSHF